MSYTLGVLLKVRRKVKTYYVQELSRIVSHLALTIVLCSPCDYPHFADGKPVLGLSTRQRRAKLKFNYYSSSSLWSLPPV